MPQAKVAKIFKNGASQAVRLPSEFRFDADEVYISRDEKTQDVILSMRPGAHLWNEFFAFVRGVETPDGWMDERPMNTVSKERNPLFREDD
ncbi:antitoxin VapB [Granulicella rosea]|uniref:Antitoxin VapB n=1 Tax=Granulicella rosea TaxID=474952 RepID=A0A239LAK6_9BACT|nr:AbrB/MazE/SpoVT family DNA-binding domain-containing protein [Granulicella rosea]SNT26689.1 antitoxin VapB [Granulicella rosea]